MQFDHLKRREFIGLFGGAAMVTGAWPVMALAQQPAPPVIGFLHPGTPEGSANIVVGFRKGLSEAGFAEGRNVAIEFRWAHNDHSRLAELAADLVRRRVSVIATPGNSSAALAAKAATTTIPVVFSVGSDPVAIGLVASLNRPGGNVIGFTSMNTELAAKRIGYLHALSPGGGRIGLFVNPDNPAHQALTAEAEAAAAVVGRQIEVLAARSFADIDKTFAQLVERPSAALLVSPGTPFGERRVQIAMMSARHAVPVMSPVREAVLVGGLVSYGPNVADEFRQAGIYTGRVLKGEKPADMPVMRATKFELVINLHTAKTIGVEVPADLLAQADEVIE